MTHILFHALIESVKQRRFYTIKAFFLMLFVLMTVGLVAVVNVYVPTQYITIREAIADCSIANETYNIFVSHGTYTENLDIIGKECEINIYSGGDDTITDDDIGAVIINGGGLKSAAKIMGCTLPIRFNGLTLISGRADSTFVVPQNMPGQQNSLIVTKAGGGVLIYESEQVDLINCIITGNCATTGAGVFVYYSDLNIIKCDINNNNHSNMVEVNYRGTAICSYRANINVEDSKIHHNHIGNSGTSTGVVYIYPVNQLQAYHNEFTNCAIYANESTFNLIYLKGLPVDNRVANFAKCTIVDNNNWGGGSIYIEGMDSPVNVETICNVTNCIVRDNTSNPQGEDNPISGGMDFELNLRHNNISNLQNYELYNDGVNELLNNINEDPLFVDRSQYDYRLGWSTTSNGKSPCIDTGYPEQINVLYDRADMGSYPPEVTPTHTFTYTFPESTQESSIKWMSFPVLYDVVNGQFTNEIEVGTLFSSIMTPTTPQLDRVIWNDIYTNNNGLMIMEYDNINQEWTYTSSLCNSQQGYKVEMHQNNAAERLIEVSGFLPVENTPIQLYGPQNDVSVENWLGFFYSKPQSIWEAFNGILDNIYYIKTQRWAVCRDMSQQDMPWLGKIPQEPTISPGEMVIIKCFQDVTFSWSGGPTEPEHYVPPTTQHFEYVEKMDYDPIFVNFSGGELELPEEIAVYVNGVCVGASVVTDSIATICAYICDDMPDNPELEFVLYYDAKKQGTVSSYKYWDYQTGRYQKGKLVIKDKRDYYKVTLGKNELDSTPLPRLQLSNYPNPFNPKTTIQYYVPQDNRVKLGIYNAKGQLVKTLVNDKKSAGMQEAIWQGTDDKGNACASGVYFCKMQYANKSVSKKLILMK